MTVVYPNLYINFTDDETQVMDTFGNILMTYPYTDEDHIFKANQYINEYRQTYDNK